MSQDIEPELDQGRRPGHASQMPWATEVHGEQDGDCDLEEAEAS